MNPGLLEGKKKSGIGNSHCKDGTFESLFKILWNCHCKHSIIGNFHCKDGAFGFVFE